MKEVNGLVPIRSNEWSKFLCLVMMIALVTYIHSILKLSKDVLILSHLTTEVISAIKVWVVLPISMLVMLLYIKLSDTFKRSTLFHLLTWFFIGFFVLFATIIYPNYQALTIQFNPEWSVRYPFLKYVLMIISNWHFTMFYLCSELWVTVMLSISAWQTINHITSMEESKRFYPLLGFSANIGMVLASYFAKYFAKHNQDWQGTLNASTISVVIAAALLSWTLVRLVKLIGDEGFNGSVAIGGRVKKHKAKLNFSDSVKMIFSSRVVLLIVLLLLSYNISLNIIEGIWKKSIELSFSGNANQIQQFMGSVSLYISLLSAALAIGGVYILKTVSWRTAALITPVLFIISGSIFFLYLIFRNSDLLQAVIVGGSAVYTAALVGAFHNIAARSSKHTIYDSTKEMVYIPLSDEIKTKGKAAAEMIGSRFGKGSGAFIQQFLLTLFPSMTLMDLTPILGVIFVVLMVAWLYSTFKLSDLLKSLDPSA